MSLFRRGGLFVSAGLLVIACGGAGQPTTGPATVAGTPQASSQPTLDPTLSDAGIVARVTITNDTRGGRDGTHDIVGVGDDGSECSGAFEEPDYIVVAYYDDAPNGQIHRFGITVAASDVPTGDGSTTDIEDGAVSFDFVSESGFGTQYTGASGRENEGSSTIDVTRSGASLIFDFEGQTYDGVNFAGQMICAGSEED